MVDTWDLCPPVWTPPSVIDAALVFLVWKALFISLWVGPPGICTMDYCWRLLDAYLSAKEKASPRTRVDVCVPICWSPWKTRKQERHLFERLEWCLALTFRMLEIPSLAVILLLPYAVVREEQASFFVLIVGLIFIVVGNEMTDEGAIG